ncbi:gluconate 2-dehydrogenase subunit 3 family protein [Rhodococcus sp. D2-41]|uniref:gluconate 2-dehydrogenase subunit 3 family protein n=1 Tax=Speluncibacter jeojiensis TaxID=2710754 RepID=UPI0024104313|nr:gluconate 2-dehydrogenase subunit 3 family protein [Rhodococcus sp. D2-41]MDG3010843.1 gluconate 2-dehydrogenase subunit 3 family protein [Rhodococcus sp. D2-41]
MSAQPIRFPGFDALSAARTWDRATVEAIRSRVGAPDDEGPDFFDDHRRATAQALLDRLLDQDDGHRVPVMPLIERRLAADATDGWHYRDMPQDPPAWLRTLDALDDDARGVNRRDFADCPSADQTAILRKVHESDDWHGLPGAHAWNLWMRYALAALYSHPQAWNAMGFPGPAYPRGYKNLGIDAREGIEVADARPGLDPAETGDGAAP